MRTAHKFSQFRLILSSPRFASTLVIAEHSKGSLSAATLSAVAAAKQFNQPIHAVLVGGGDAKSAAQTLAKTSGVASVDVISHDALEHQEAERVCGVLNHYLSTVRPGDFSHVIAASSNHSKNFVPRLSALLDVSPVTDVIKILSPDTFVRPIYAGNALSTVQSTDQLKVVTIRPTNFAAESGEQAPCEVKEVNAGGVDQTLAMSTWESASASGSDRPDLGSARIIVSGGRAMKSGENFSILYQLADKLGAAVGASRAAVDAGFVSNDLQIGQTGKVVAPDLYIAVGISGAIQHLAGMKDSKCIVVINKDPEAPFFQVADYGLEADLFDAVPKLTEKF